MEVSTVFVGTFAGVVLLNFHVLVHGHDIKERCSFCWELLHQLVSPTKMSGEEIQKKQRIEEELHKMRLQIFKAFSCAIHIDFFMLLRICWKIVCQPSAVTLFDACECTFLYVFFTIFSKFSMIEMRPMWKVYEFVVLITHATSVYLRPDTACAAGLDAKYQAIVMIALSSSMLESWVTLPFCCFEGLVNLYKTSLRSGDAEYRSLFLDELAICGITCMLVVVIERLARLHIESRLQSGDHSCRLTGFRSVLRGVCDGDILLDPNKNLVEDTTSLERLLNVQKKLSGTNFTNLFQSVEDRIRFLEFLATSSNYQPDMNTPSACRVTLQGSLGPVSLDLFHVRVVNFQSDSKDQKDQSFFHLIAIKQDADQAVIPDAMADSGPSLNDTDFSTDPAPSSVGSQKDIALSYNNLKEITLLLTSHSSMWDIGELHAKYQRRNFLDCGMPTLRNFVKHRDWERVLRRIEDAKLCRNSSDRVHFSKPLCLRLPGEPGAKYLRARNVSVGSVGRASDSPDPVLLWMNFADLEFGQVRQLVGIHEWGMKSLSILIECVDVIWCLIWLAFEKPPQKEGRKIFGVCFCWTAVVIRFMQYGLVIWTTQNYSSAISSSWCEPWYPRVFQKKMNLRRLLGIGPQNSEVQNWTSYNQLTTCWLTGSPFFVCGVLLDLLTGRVYFDVNMWLDQVGPIVQSSTLSARLMLTASNGTQKLIQIPWCQKIHLVYSKNASNIPEHPVTIW